MCNILCDVELDNRSLEQLITDWGERYYSEECKLLEYLIDCLGVNVEIKLGFHGVTPLMIAVFRDWRHCVRTLLYKYNANINEQDNHGQTALMLSICLRRVSCFEFLLEHPDININIYNNAFNNAFNYALRRSEENDYFISRLLPFETRMVVFEIFKKDALPSLCKATHSRQLTE